MVRADHSSGDIKDGMPDLSWQPAWRDHQGAGEPTVWHLGDTDIFSDMALISEIHRPKVRSCRLATVSRWEPRRPRWREALPQCRDRDPVPLRHIRHHRPDRRQISSPSLKGHATKVIVPEKGQAFGV